MQLIFEGSCNWWLGKSDFLLLLLLLFFAVEDSAGTSFKCHTHDPKHVLNCWKTLYSRASDEQGDSIKLENIVQ